MGRDVDVCVFEGGGEGRDIFGEGLVERWGIFGGRE